MRLSPSPANKTREKGPGHAAQLLADFSVLDLLVVVVSPPGAALFDVVVVDSEDFSETDGAAGAAAAP